MQVILQIAQALALALGETAGRDAGGTRDHLGDLPLVDDRRCTGLLTGGHRVDARLRLHDLVTQARCLLVVLGADCGVLTGLEIGELRHERRSVHGQAQLQAQPCTGLVDQVDRLVGQHTVGQVAGAHRHGCAQRGIRVGHPVVVLVRVRQPLEDEHGVVDARLVDLHGLEAALQRRVLLDLAVLLERRRADHVQVAACETGLQDVARVHAALT